MESPWVCDPIDLLDMNLANTLGKSECEAAMAVVLTLCNEPVDPELLEDRPDLCGGWDRIFYFSEFTNPYLQHGFLHLLGRGWMVSYAGSQGFGIHPDTVEHLFRLKHVPVDRRHLEP